MNIESTKSKLKDVFIASDHEVDNNEKYSRDGQLTKKKLIEYLPAMMVTNLSVLLLVTVDGLVVGNLVNENALSSVNVIYPAVSFLGIASILVATGISTSISRQMGKGDQMALRRLKNAGLKLMLIVAVIISLLQIPAFYFIIDSYHLKGELLDMTWAYSIGIMLTTPFGLVSTVGVYQLQIIGKMKILAALAVTEGIVNLVFDLLFVGVFKMGVAGAGYGTAVASIVRCIITVIFLIKKTDVYNSGGVKGNGEDIKTILTCGLPECSYSVMSTIQAYLFMHIVLSYMPDDGGAIRGVCTFCYTLVYIFISGVVGSMRPLAGLLSGANDTRGLRILVKQCLNMCIILIGIATVIIELIPWLFFSIHGVKDPTDLGISSLRIYGINFIFSGINSVFLLYFSNRKDTKFATTLTVVGNATLPLFAYIFGSVIGPAWIWFSYTVMNIMILTVYIRRYLGWIQKDKENDDPNSKTLYMTVKAEEAIEASRYIRNYAQENDFPLRVANRASLCMEEMAAYAKQSQKNDKLLIQIIVKFTKDEVFFMMLDTGECIALDEDKDVQKLTTDNYELIKRLSKSVEYQYLLNMNYTRIVV